MTNDGQGRVNFEVVRGLVAAGHQVDLVVANGAITSAPVDINGVHFVHGGWAVSPYYDVGEGLRGLYQRLYTGVNTRLERRAFARATRIITVSGQVASEVAALGVPRDKIEVIPNGVDVEAFSPEGEKAVLEVPTGAVRALFVGDIVSRRKGLDTVLAAMPDIAGLYLVVVGRSEASPYPEMVEAAGLSERVTFLGFRRDIPAIMRACDLFVFPSRYEPFGLVILEALSSGLPVVTALTAGCAEFLDDEASVKIGDPDDAAALRGALERIVSDPGLRARMGARGRDAALSLTWDKMAEHYVALFVDVLAHETCS